MNLYDIYNTLNQTQAEHAISIFVPTHRTFPDNQQDAIALKNSLSELETRLLENTDKRQVETILKQIEQVLVDHDHNYNLDTLAIFATAENAQLFRLPFQTVPRIVIDERFALRELLRELNNGVGYYLLTISKTQARLIEAYNDTIVHEFDQSTELQNPTFPIQNDIGGNAERGNDIAEENSYKEYLNRVDKSVQEIYNQNKLPVFVVADSRTAALYEQESDNKAIIAGSITNSSHTDGSIQNVLNDSQDTVAEYRKTQQLDAVEKIGQARGQNLLLEDITDIYTAAVEGRVSEIFVRKGYVQPAKIDAEKRQIQLTDQDDRTTDDLVDDLIEATIQNGGHAYFIAPEVFPEGANLYAKTRY
jgi:hypothetical protein